MGLFEDLGRRVEEFKQEAEEASRATAVAECADCGELLYSDRENCPECGSERLHQYEGSETERDESETG